MSHPENSNRITEQRLNYFAQCLGEELYLLRRGQNKSIKVVAKDTKMSPSIVSKIEKGLYENFYLSRLLRICKYYNADMRDLISRAEYKDRNNTI
ncbi:helix-turn-helix domain-containing protein [Chitinophaga sancti]|uniref:helix-turn-helix domain-containing protein n=1 Tax=Chitinophaga sancti TaxID=1004 RepID=UPI0039BDA899